MASLNVASFGTKFELLCQFARKQGTAHATAEAAGVSSYDFGRRTRELVQAGWITPTGKQVDGQPVFKITDDGRALCRSLKK